MQVKTQSVDEVRVQTDTGSLFRFLREMVGRTRVADLHALNGKRIESGGGHAKAKQRTFVFSGRVVTVTRRA